MNLVIYGNVKDKDVFSTTYHDDRIVDTWDLSDTKLNIKSFLEYPYTCILLLDGEYNDMFITCLDYDIASIRILNVERYNVYKEIERKLTKKDNSNAWEYISCLFYEFQKIIKLYQYDNQVIQKCKDDFIKRISLGDWEIF